MAIQNYLTLSHLRKAVASITQKITSDLVGLTDTSITSPANEQFLQYNSSTSKWENKTYTAPVTSVNGNTGDVTIAIPTKTSDLTNDSDFMTGMTILSYGSSSWADFIDAYTNKRVVYCRASSNSNPASGSQTRLAFMAYVNNADNPTEVEFQYYRSVSSHSNNQQGDQVYVYKLNKSSGWSVTVRENYTKVVAGTGLTGNWANGAITLKTDTTIENTSNKTTTLSSSSTDTEYPSAKAVYDAIQSLSSRIDSLEQ